MDHLNLIGPGKLGQTLARLWVAGGHLRLVGVLGRDIARVQAAVTLIGAQPRAATQVTQLPPARITLIATPDDALADVAQDLLAGGRMRAGDIVLHCSGATPSAALTPLQQAGVLIASVHPLKSFAGPASASNTFAGTWCGAEGDAAALAVLQPLFEAIGGRWFALKAEHKLLYHAGAVLACNHLVALMEAALRCMETAGLPRDFAWAALQPLVVGTLTNLSQRGTVQALTGPAARGDLRILTAESVATQQLGAAVGNVYDALTVVALELAASKSSV